jgi:hypothetical protein
LARDQVRSTLYRKSRLRRRADTTRKSDDAKYA